MISKKLRFQNGNIPGNDKCRSFSAFIRSLKMNKALLIMLIPGLLYYLIFCYGPIYGLIIAFKDYRIVDGILASPWVGFKHFETLFSNSDFWRVLRNTVIISSMNLIINFPAPIILALLLNEVRSVRFKKVIQTASYLPHFLSWVVLAGIVKNVLSPSSGIVNAAITALGGKPIFFVANNNYFRFVLVGSALWKEVGWSSIVYLAALSSVDPELYEAARMDGAGRFKQMIHITLPSITNVIVIMLIRAVGGIISDDFDQVFNLITPAVHETGDVLSTLVYRNGIAGMKFSFSTAVGLFRNVIGFILIMITNYISRKFSEYSLF